MKGAGCNEGAAPSAACCSQHLSQLLHSAAGGAWQLRQQSALALMPSSCTGEGGSMKWEEMRLASRPGALQLCRAEPLLLLCQNSGLRLVCCLTAQRLPPAPPLPPPGCSMQDSHLLRRMINQHFAGGRKPQVFVVNFDVSALFGGFAAVAPCCHACRGMRGRPACLRHSFLYRIHSSTVFTFALPWPAAADACHPRRQPAAA